MPIGHVRFAAEERTAIKRIEPRSGIAFELSKGETLRVVDIEGQQVADLLAFSKDDQREVISNGRTFDYEETISLSLGNVLWSNRSRKMLAVTRDDVGKHDFLLTPCSEDTFKHFYPDKPVHRGCFGNLAEALSPWAIAPDDIPTAFNVFMNVPVADNGALEVDPPTGKAGDAIELRAEMDLIIGLTACSAYASNGGTFKPIGYEVLKL